MPTNTEKTQLIPRPPVIAVMGHIDHGKSTLLSYIRKSNRPLNEAGGITQHVSAYEVTHKDSTGKEQKLTFIDTPGHAAFSGIRKRGASLSDIAILVVSAEDGVKPQTLEALHSILDSKTPYIVAITKIDKPDANVERTKMSLAEHEIYVEGYGGTIPVVLLSSKTGEGVSELLDLIILQAELEDLKANPNILASGIVVESNLDPRKGISTTCVIKNGTLKKGQFLVAGESWSPLRSIENYLGQNMDTATFSSPIQVIGWNTLPKVGNIFETFSSREDALNQIEKNKENLRNDSNNDLQIISSTHKFPIIIKADTAGSLEAIIGEIKKMTNQKIAPQIISSGIGSITENDVRLANGSNKALVVGFGVTADGPAHTLSLRDDIKIKTFDIIYKMSEWLSEELTNATPKEEVEETNGVAKVLKVFSKVKDRQIIGARVEQGFIALGSSVKIWRRETLLCKGKIRELQQNKKQTSEVPEGAEFGTMVEAKIEIAPGDKIESFVVVEK